MLGQNIGRVGLPDMSAGGRPSLTLDFVSIPVLNEKITFSRASGATWFSPDGVLKGVDFSTTSVAIGTGSKSFTLTATAGVNRYWAVNDLVRVSQQSNSANFMEGTVTSYTASTQVLVIDVTSTGGSGTIASWRVASHMPRFDYNPSTLAARGLLIEEARTNLFLQSADFTTTWVTGFTTIAANATASPDGGTNGDKLQELAVTNEHYVRQFLTGLTTNTTYTVSVFVKASERTRFRIRILDTDNVANGYLADYNLTTVVASGSGSGAGSITGTPSITSVGNGWFRCVVSGNASTGTKYIVDFFALNAAGSVNYLGVAGEGLFIWGAQLEAGAFPTSYIPTTTTALTRSADVASVNTLSPWFNATEGTLFAEGILVGGVAATFPNQVGFVGSNANTDTIRIGWNANASVMNYGARVSGTGQAGLSAGPNKSAGSSYKVAGRYAVNNFQASFDGALGTLDTSGTLPTITSLLLGGVATFQPSGNLWLRRFTFYPRALADAELQALTA